MLHYSCINAYGWSILFAGVSIMIDLKQIEEKTREYYQKAKAELALFERRGLQFEHSALSDVIPNYKSDLLDFGAYLEDNFAGVKRVSLASLDDISYLLNRDVE